MTKLGTNLRCTIENAKIVRYFTNIVNATNVQDAIDQFASLILNPIKPPNLTPVTVTAAMSPYPMVATNWNIQVDTTAGPVTIELLPSAQMLNLPAIIKHIAGDAEANPVTLDPAVGETVDNMDPYVIDYNFGGVTLRPKQAGGGYAVEP